MQKQNSTHVSKPDTYLHLQCGAHPGSTEFVVCVFDIDVQYVHIQTLKFLYKTSCARLDWGNMSQLVWFCAF